MPGQIEIRRVRRSSAPSVLASPVTGSFSGTILDEHQSELEFERDLWSHLRSRRRTLNIKKGIIRLLYRPWRLDNALLRAYDRPNRDVPAIRQQLQHMWLNRVPVSLREPLCQILERERIFAVQLSVFLDDCQKFEYFDDVRFSSRHPRRSRSLQRQPRRLQQSRRPHKCLSILPSERKRKAPEQLDCSGAKKTKRCVSFGAKGSQSNRDDRLGSLDVLPRELIDRIIGNVSLHDLPYLRLVNPAMKTVVDELTPLKKVTDQLNTYVLSGLAWWTRWAEEKHFDPDHIWSTPLQLLNRKEHMEALKLVSQAVDLVGNQGPDYDRTWPDLVHAWWNVVTYAALVRIHCEKWDCEELMTNILDSKHSYLLEVWEADDE